MVYCLFEQSGTFKNAFISKGEKAIDIDILNDFGETDLQLDLFKEIEAIENSALFQKITASDLILAFFPCTWFSDNNFMFCQGTNLSFKNWDKDKKAEYWEQRKKQRSYAFSLLKKLICFCKRKGLSLIVENPRSKFLTYWLTPSVYHNDRRVYGDKFKKPTIYFCINCKLNESKLSKYEIKTKLSPLIAKCSKVERSLITPLYASNFISAIERR